MMEFGVSPYIFLYFDIPFAIALVAAVVYVDVARKRWAEMEREVDQMAETATEIRRKAEELDCMVEQISSECLIKAAREK